MEGWLRLGSEDWKNHKRHPTIINSEGERKGVMVLNEDEYLNPYTTEGMMTYTQLGNTLFRSN